MSPHTSSQFLRNTKLITLLITIIVLSLGTAFGQRHGDSDINTYISRLKSQDSRMRAGAADSLAHFGPDAIAAIPELVRLLDDQETETRAAAANALGEIGPASKAAIPKLVELLADANRDVRLTAADAFVNIGSAENIPTLITLLKDDNKNVRESACHALGEIGPAAKDAIPDLVVLLNDPDREIRAAAAYTLGAFGYESKAAVPALIKSLNDSDDKVQYRAARALSNIDVDESEAAIPAITTLLSSQNGRLREGAAYSLGVFGPPARAAVPDLIKLLKDPEVQVRKTATEAIGRIGPEARAAVPFLIDLLNHEDSEFRSLATIAISNIGPEAKEAVPSLIKLCNDREDYLRLSAIDALGNIGPDARSAVPILTNLLESSHDTIRWKATVALGRIGPDSKTAVPKLVQLLKSKDEYDRSNASLTLGGIGPDAKVVIPLLIEALKDSSRAVRLNASASLGRFGPEAKAAVPVLIELLENQDVDLRKNAAYSLGAIGAMAREASPALIKLLNNSDYSVRNNAAQALVNISVALSVAKSAEFVNQLKDIHQALKGSQYPEVRNNADQVKQAIDSLETSRISQIKEWIKDHPYLATILALVLWLPFALLISYVLMRLRPIWLFRFNEVIPNSINIKILEHLGEIKLPIKYVLGVGFFHYHPRVLDAWVAMHINVAREEFERLDTVRTRNIHVEVPVILEGRTLATLSVKDLKPIFSKTRICLLIWGEGGSGKTSLACQIARWAMADQQSDRLCPHLMIPILMDHDVKKPTADSGSTLKEAVRGGLQALLNKSKAETPELVERLLRSKRILVIADHLSEMSEETRQVITPAQADFPATALIITSRIEERLDSFPKAIIKSLRIGGNRLSSFMEAYLLQQGKRELFDDLEFFDGCRRLSILVGDRDITVLLAKFYADQMIAVRETNGTTSELPDNIPDLMLAYLMHVNMSMGRDGIPNKIVIESAKQLAWECIKVSYQPTSIKLTDAFAILGGEERAKSLINYFQLKISLLQKSWAVEGYVRFVLDPLAEYLAALNLVELYGRDEVKWREFLSYADKLISEKQNMKEFLLAVRDCCLSKDTLDSTPPWLPAELVSKAGLDPNVVKKIRNQGGSRSLPPVGV